ncbi:MAG: phosphoribosylanthranilate isomerase, partial [Deltaproteobacteria bacterium]|nr:phosphoribosylanthranilate isomerase [Deltaproteobacteria bacterium]
PYSKRHVSATRADDVAEAAREVNGDIEVVGVFVNQSNYEISHFVDRLELDYVQLHGDEQAADVGRYGELAIKAVHLQGPEDVTRCGDFPCDTLLVDAPSPGYGGSGLTSDWSLAHLVSSGSGKKVILAGGLGPENVVAAISEVAPWAVDVASGVEWEPGVKNPDKVKAFIERAKGQGI